MFDIQFKQMIGHSLPLILFSYVELLDKLLDVFCFSLFVTFLSHVVVQDQRAT